MTFNINNSEIRDKLYEFKNQIDDDSDEENQGKITQNMLYIHVCYFHCVDWKTCTMKVDDIAKKIWGTRCYEREHCPRAGIILLYCDPSGSIEVSYFSRNSFFYYYILLKILLTMYIKNNEIRYGFSKGKIEFWETILGCAVREVS